MTSPSETEENDVVSELDEEDTIEITREECIALMKECEHSYISYENPIAVSLIRRIRKFADYEK